MEKQYCDKQEGSSVKEREEGTIRKTPTTNEAQPTRRRMPPTTQNPTMLKSFEKAGITQATII